MHKSLCLISVAALLFVGCGQTSTDKNSAPKADTTKAPNLTDANGKKQGPWKITGEVEHVPGYTEKDVIREGNYKDGKKQGLWIEYYPGGSVKDKIEYRNDTLVKVVEMDSVKR